MVETIAAGADIAGLSAAWARMKPGLAVMRPGHGHMPNRLVRQAIIIHHPPRHLAAIEDGDDCCDGFWGRQA